MMRHRQFCKTIRFFRSVGQYNFDATVQIGLAGSAGCLACHAAEAGFVGS